MHAVPWKQAFQEYWRLAHATYSYVGARPLTGDPLEWVRFRHETRAERWLEWIRWAVFENPASPYLPLFRAASCQYADLVASVRRYGLEASLQKLFDAGIYVTEDEFKGRQEIRREGVAVAPGPEGFRNPVGGGLPGRSSGSRGIATRTITPVAKLVQHDVYRLLEARAFNLHEYVRAEVRPALPSTIGLTAGIGWARVGLPLARWFAYGASRRRAIHYRVLTRSLAWLAQLRGIPVPSPSYLADGDFGAVASWIAQQKALGRSAAIGCFVSPAVQIAEAALRLGLNLEGTLFFAGGEPMTPERRGAIERSGALAYSRYWITELGPIALSCQYCRERESLHVLSDSVAVFSKPAEIVPGCGPVPVLWFTSLDPASPFVLINVAMGDVGKVFPSRCNCVFTQVGLPWEVTELCSYSKLTGQGMTMHAWDLVELLERKLPGRFGGGPGDYQLVEILEPVARWELRVRPGVCHADAETIRLFFLSECRQFYGGALTSEVFRQCGGLQVKFTSPVRGATGKVFPVELGARPVGRRQ